MAAATELLSYHLEKECPVAWTDVQESQLHAEYPLTLQDTPDNYVIRRYLEALWLPESISNLSHFILSLRNMQISSSSSLSEPHPLHQMLEPVVLSLRAASDKFLVELPQIITDGGGAGEEEELMMWYNWNNAKYAGASADEVVKVEEEERWKRQWLEKLAQREAMIQTLILFFKLSLPGTCPPFIIIPDAEVSPKKTKKARTKKAKPITETVEDRLEHYMDKLSMWQLTDSLEHPQHANKPNPSTTTKSKDERHWTQAFCEDVVQPLFSNSLSASCKLLHEKLFPHTVFSDEEQNERAVKPLKRKKSNASSVADESAATSRSKTASRRSSVESSKSRSRSLSVSIAQDESEQKRNVVEPKRIRMMSREVSMSRTFKEKERHVRDLSNDPAAVMARSKSTMTVVQRKPTLPKTLVAETPVKNRTGVTSVAQLSFNHNLDESPSKRSSSSQRSNGSAILIEDTPIARRTQSQEPFRPTDVGSALQMDWDDEDEFMDSFGSPDVLLLGSNGYSATDAEMPMSPLSSKAGRILVLDTPVRSR